MYRGDVVIEPWEDGKRVLDEVRVGEGQRLLDVCIMLLSTGVAEADWNLALILSVIPRPAPFSFLIGLSSSSSISSSFLPHFKRGGL